MAQNISYPFAGMTRIRFPIG